MSMVARLDGTPTDSDTFATGTMGALIQGGAGGWGEAYTAEVGGARVSVAASDLELVLQSGCQDASCVSYVRLKVDIGVERDGEHTRLHVEDLYPARALELLGAPLDEGAPARVREAIVETLVGLDAEDPVGNLVANCIAPMRLFEPVLNALVAPSPTGTMASWAAARFAELLKGECAARAQTEVWRARVVAREVSVCTDLRSHGQVKLVGEVELEGVSEGSKGGCWKSRATLVAPSLEWRERPEPDEDAVLEAIRAWRDELEDNLAARLARRGGPIMLSEIAPQLDL